MRLLLGGMVAFLVLSVASSARADERAACLLCHRNTELRGTVRGEPASVWVDADELERSAHGGLQCSECHVGAGLPHDDDLPPVDCARCHEEEVRFQHESRHGQAAHEEKWKDLAPDCRTCHGGAHQVVSHRDPAAATYPLNIPRLCGRCHTEGTEVSESRDISQDRIIENYSLSLHGDGLFRQGLSVTAVCTSCHTPHLILPRTDPRSSINRKNVAVTCTRCHAMISQVHRKVIEGERWRTSPDQVPACTDCHAPHKPEPHDVGSETRTCLTCHGPGKKDPSFDRAGFFAGAHGRLECAQCHTDIDPSREDRSCAAIVAPVDCAACHEDQVARYGTSTHGTLAARGDADAPVCLDCHAHHATRTRRDADSPTFPRNVPDLCGRCHRRGEKAARRIHADVEDIVSSYEDSIHGKGLMESGLTVTATCASCHSAHGELPPDDPRSTIYRSNVADTCGQCHYGIEETFKTSIHWPGASDADPDSLPTCTNCHTSHNITRVDQGNFRLKMMDQCGRCHEAEAETFFETYHGKVSRGGEAAPAKCHDCHGTHNILPPDDLDSTLSRDHVVETCGQCHEGAHRRFAGYLTHATHHDQKKYPWLFWTFWGMTALLVGTLSFAFLHTGAWLWRLTRTRGEWKRHTAAAAEEKLYRRFTKTQRTFHLLMLLSFFTLGLTGMALKFSYMGWARVVARVLGGYESMGVIHRMGACLLITVFVLHLRDVRRRVRQSGQTWKQVLTGPTSILFTKRDLVEFFQSIRWFLGRGPRPRYGRFTYWEKFDYFAVFWGIAVIGSTGLVLWFPELFTHLLPGWSVNVATIIHSDEALLALGFIFTVHFFNTHFRPDKFPMDPVIFTGRVPLEEFKYDKPGEYERLERSGELEARLVKPLPRRVERGMRIFGFVALAVGLTLIALIVYTMIFGYR